jgi:hypothetical protein
MQLKTLEEQAAAGKIGTWQPPEPQPPKSLLETHGLPPVLQTLRQDPEQLAAHTISCSMWRANPGYLARDGQALASVSQSDFSWKEEEVGAAGGGVCEQGGRAG